MTNAFAAWLFVSISAMGLGIAILELGPRETALLGRRFIDGGGVSILLCCAVLTSVALLGA